MDVETLKNYALSKPATTFDFPFDEETMTLRVKNKIFVLVPTKASPAQANFKCDPNLAEILRQTYSAITPGYHQNKRHWNTVIFDASISDDDILEMVDHAYDQVVKGLPKKDREALQKP